MSNLTLKHQPRTFEEAAKVLGSKDQVTIGHNTHLKAGDGVIYATYHHNEIVEYSPDGVMASWAGWTTNTTANRLNKLTNGRFNIKQREPHLNGQPVDSSTWLMVN
jgi:hypothetical protein